MEEKKGLLEEFIKKELERDAEEIRRENEAEGGVMPEDLKIDIRKKLDEQIEEIEWRRKYPGLSDEEIRALRIGRKIIESEKKERAEAKENGIGRTESAGSVENTGNTGGVEAVTGKSGTENTVEKKSAEEKGGERTKVRKRRGFRFYGGLVAVLALVFAIGVTSLGGAERVVRFMKSVVGEREIQQVDSSDENMVLVEEDEEEAYQMVREEFGIEPVKVMTGALRGMSFTGMELDKMSQFAQFSYLFEGENIIYFISASYKTSSFGMDVEEQAINKYQLLTEECVIEIGEYKTKDKQMNRYLATFKYKGLEYFFIGTMKKDEVELILKNLHFF